MSEGLLGVLKACLLILVYLFFLRVLRAVWVEIRGPQPIEAAAAARNAKRAARRPRRNGDSAGPPELIVVEPVEIRGNRYELVDELTLGRSSSCNIHLDDTFVSQVHARLFLRDGQPYIEDLGSTNGTYLNRQKVGGPVRLQRGDLLQIGRTLMEMT